MKLPHLNLEISIKHQEIKEHETILIQHNQIRHNKTDSILRHM